MMVTTSSISNESGKAGNWRLPIGDWPIAFVRRRIARVNRHSALRHSAIRFLMEVSIFIVLIFFPLDVIPAKRKIGQQHGRRK